MQEIRECLTTCATFQALSPTQVVALAQCCHVQTVARGTCVYGETESPHHVYLMAEGRVRISHIDETGKQSILHLISPGQLFGELAICLKASREERGETMVDSVIVTIPADDLRHLIHENAELSFDMLSLFSVRRQAMERRLKGILFQSTRHRLISLLQELADPGDTSDVRELRIRQTLSHQDLASMIGVTRETVTITLGQLRAEGAIRIDRRQIVILQPDRFFTGALQQARQRVS